MSKTYRKVQVVELSTSARTAGRVVETPMRAVADDELLVRNLYAGVNATDMNITAGRGGYGAANLPFDFGLEGLGVIEALGKSVQGAKGLNVGQVGLVFTGPPTGPPRAYSEYIYVKPDEFKPIPENKPEYLALLDCGLTACIGLDQAGRITRGETVLITAAAGGTGHIGVQWAKYKGCHVIGMASAPEKIKLLKELGCDRVINYRTENLDEILTNEYTSGIDVIWETIGGKTFETLFKHLAVGGRLVIVGSITGYKDQTSAPVVSIPDINSKLLGKSQTLVGFRFRSFSHLFDKYLNELYDMYAKKQLKIIIDFGPNAAFNGINTVVDAIEYLHTGASIGKVLVKL